MNGFQWVVASVLTLVGGIVLGSSAGVGVGLAIGLAAAISWIAGSRAKPGKLVARREMEAPLLPVGGSILVRMRLSGRGAGTFAWTRVRDFAPEGTVVEVPTGRFVVGAGAVKDDYFYRVHFPKRGAYRLGPLEIASGDLLGLRVQKETGAVSDEVLVHPLVTPLLGASVRSNRPFGDRSADRRATEDPTRPVGARAFQSGDSLKRIHWPASARTGVLMSRLYDSATGALAWIVPNLCREDWPDAETFELGMQVCASLAVALPEISGISRTGVHEGVPEPSRRETLLAAIARLEADSTPFAERLLADQPMIPWRASILVVTSRLGTDAASVLDDRRRAGHSVSVVAVGPSVSTTVSRAAMIGAEVATVATDKEIGGIAFFR